MHGTWKTPGAVVAEQRTLKAQMRRQQKKQKKPRSDDVPNLPASSPDVVQLPGSQCKYTGHLLKRSSLERWFGYSAHRTLDLIFSSWSSSTLFVKKIRRLSTKCTESARKIPRSMFTHGASIYFDFWCSKWVSREIKVCLNWVCFVTYLLQLEVLWVGVSRKINNAGGF